MSVGAATRTLHARTILKPGLLDGGVVFIATAGDRLELDLSHANDLAELHSPRHWRRRIEFGGLPSARGTGCGNARRRTYRRASACPRRSHNYNRRGRHHDVGLA